MSAASRSFGFGIVALSLATAGSASAALVNSFESPTYTTGNINGQDGGQWSVTSFAPGTHSANVVTTPTPYDGSQALQIIDGGAGYFEPVRYDLSAANVLAAGPTNGGNFSMLFKALANPSPSSQSGFGINLRRVQSDNQFDIRRETLFFGSSGEIIHYNQVGGATTTLGTYTGNVWYLINIVSHTDGGGNLLSDFTVTNTATNTVVANGVGLASGNEAGRTHWGGVDFTTDSTPPGQWLVDGITFNAPPVPEPASGLMLLGGAGLAALCRRRQQ